MIIDAEVIVPQQGSPADDTWTLPTVPTPSEGTCLHAPADRRPGEPGADERNSADIPLAC